MVEPPLPHCAYDKEQSDAVRPNDNDVWREPSAARKTSWETPQVRQASGAEHVDVTEGHGPFPRVCETRLLETLAHLVVVDVNEAVDPPTAIPEPLVG